MKKKSNYSKPKVTKVVLDNQIALVMMSPGPTPPTDPPKRQAPAQSKEWESPFKDI